MRPRKYWARGHGCSGRQLTNLTFKYAPWLAANKRTLGKDVKKGEKLRANVAGRASTPRAHDLMGDGKIKKNPVFINF